MASTREERMQQRLRGSQRRQVKDVDFGLTFAPIPAFTQPPTLPLRRSPRRSLELAPQLSTRPTPDSRARSQPPIATPADEKLKPAITHSAVDANTSAKRRKLDTDGPTSSRSTRSSLPAPRLNVYSLNADEGPETAPTNGSIESSAYIEQLNEPDTSASLIQTERTPSPVGEVEITESPSHAPGSGHRTRTLVGSVLQSSRLQDEFQIDSSVQIEPPGSPTHQRKRKRGNSIPDTGRSRRSRASASNLSVELNVPGDEDELSPDQPRRGRRRRSSIQRESLPKPDTEESDEERETAEEIEDVEAAAILKKNRGRRHSRHAPAEPSPDLDEPSEQIVPPKTQHSRPRQAPISSPAHQRHPKNAKPKAASKPSKKAAMKQTRVGSSIPVTAYRLTKGPTYDEDEADADILNADIPYAERRGVNVIDVLSQVCQEVITSSLETIQEHSTNAQESALRREFGAKKRYVEAYKTELTTRLLGHTLNLDNMFSLERRVREEEKKKLALRAEILELRERQQQVALRKDAVRIRHEMESKDGQELDTLNTAIHDIELAVERGREQNPYNPVQGPVERVGVELLLKRIAGEVSNKSDSGGMLKQIKDFNAFLERTAVALEGRKV